MIEIYNPHMHKDGLFFYPLSRDDLRDLYLLFTDDSVAFHFSAPRTNNQFIGTEDLLVMTESWIQDKQRDFADNRAAYFAVQEKGRFVALVGLAIQQELYRSGRILLAVHPKRRHQGLGKTIVTAVTTWAINELGLARLEISTPGNNEPSRSLALACGFLEEGENTFSRLSPANQLIESKSIVRA